MESAKDLSDFERKLVIIIQHHNKRDDPTSLDELELRTGHTPNEIKAAIKELVKREWLEISENKLIVLKKLF